MLPAVCVVDLTWLPDKFSVSRASWFYQNYIGNFRLGSTGVVRLTFRKFLAVMGSPLKLLGPPESWSLIDCLSRLFFRGERENVHACS